MKNIIRSVLLGFFLALFISACEKQETPVEAPVRPVKVVKVGDTEELFERQFPGRSSATQEVDLSFRVSGPLITRPVDVGDEVKKGQILARIDPRDLLSSPFFVLQYHFFEPFF